MIQRGSHDMGSVTDISSVCRFWLPGQRARIVRIRVTFTGTASKVAAMSFKIDAPQGEAFDRVIRDYSAAGTGANILFRTPVGDDTFILEVGEILVLEWTNPDDGNVTWVADVELVAA